MTKQAQDWKVEGGIAKLIVNHNGKDLTFLHPAYGYGTYAKVAEQIEKDGLLKPTMAEVASLVYGAFNSNDKYGNEIKNIMKSYWLWGFTGILYVPKKGAYIQDNPEIRNGRPYMEESDLVKKLEENNLSVRFVPFGYKTKSMNCIELAKNKFVIGLAGKEGAEKLVEVAGKHKSHKPYLWGFKSVDKPSIRVSTMDSGWGLGGRRLIISGDDLCGDSYWQSFGFGIQKKY